MKKAVLPALLALLCAFACSRKPVPEGLDYEIQGISFPPTFPGDLRGKFYATDAANGTPGTYTRASGGTVWARR